MSSANNVYYSLIISNRIHISCMVNAFYWYAWLTGMLVRTHTYTHTHLHTYIYIRHYENSDICSRIIQVDNTHPHVYGHSPIYTLVYKRMHTNTHRRINTYMCLHIPPPTHTAGYVINRFWIWRLKLIVSFIWWAVYLTDRQADM